MPKVIDEKAVQEIKKNMNSWSYEEWRVCFNEYFPSLPPGVWDITIEHLFNEPRQKEGMMVSRLHFTVDGKDCWQACSYSAKLKLLEYLAKLKMVSVYDLQNVGLYVTKDISKYLASKQEFDIKAQLLYLSADEYKNETQTKNILALHPVTYDKKKVPFLIYHLEDTAVTHPEVIHGYVQALSPDVLWRILIHYDRVDLLIDGLPDVYWKTAYEGLLKDESAKFYWNDGVKNNPKKFFELFKKIALYKGAECARELLKLLKPEILAIFKKENADFLKLEPFIQTNPGMALKTADHFKKAAEAESKQDEMRLMQNRLLQARSYMLVEEKERKFYLNDETTGRNATRAFNEAFGAFIKKIQKVNEPISLAFVENTFALLVATYEQIEFLKKPSESALQPAAVAPAPAADVKSSADVKADAHVKKIPKDFYIKFLPVLMQRYEWEAKRNDVRNLTIIERYVEKTFLPQLSDYPDLVPVVLNALLAGYSARLSQTKEPDLLGFLSLLRLLLKQEIVGKMNRLVLLNHIVNAIKFSFPKITTTWLCGTLIIFIRDIKDALLPYAKDGQLLLLQALFNIYLTAVVGTYRYFELMGAETTLERLNDSVSWIEACQSSLAQLNEHAKKVFDENNKDEHEQKGKINKKFTEEKLSPIVMAHVAAIYKARGDKYHKELKDDEKAKADYQSAANLNDIQGLYELARLQGFAGNGIDHYIKLMHSYEYPFCAEALKELKYHCELLSAETPQYKKVKGAFDDKENPVDELRINQNCALLNKEEKWPEAKLLPLAAENNIIAMARLLTLYEQGGDNNKRRGRMMLCLRILAHATLLTKEQKANRVAEKYFLLSTTEISKITDRATRYLTQWATEEKRSMLPHVQTELTQYKQFANWSLQFLTILTSPRVNAFAKDFSVDRYVMAELLNASTTNTTDTIDDSRVLTGYGAQGFSDVSKLTGEEKSNPVFLAKSAANFDRAMLLDHYDRGVQDVFGSKARLQRTLNCDFERGVLENIKKDQEAPIKSKRETLFPPKPSAPPASAVGAGPEGQPAGKALSSDALGQAEGQDSGATPKK